MFIEQVTIFHKRSGTKFLSPFFCNASDVGYHASHLQDGSSWTCWTSVQNKILFQFLYLFTLIFKVVRNLFKTFHLHGSSWFRYWMIAHTHNLNTFCCPLESVGQQNPASNYLFFYWQIRRQPAVNDYPLHGCISLGWSEWSIATESTVGKDSLVSLMHCDLSYVESLNVN